MKWTFFHMLSSTQNRPGNYQMSSSIYGVRLLLRNFFLSCFFAQVKQNAVKTVPLADCLSSCKGNITVILWRFQ